MPLTLKCPKCSGKTVVPDEHTGPRIFCSGCGVSLAVPPRPAAVQTIPFVEPLPPAAPPPEEEPILLPLRRGPIKDKLYGEDRKYTVSDLTAYDWPQRGLGFLMAAAITVLAGLILSGTFFVVGMLTLPRSKFAASVSDWAVPFTTLDKPTSPGGLPFAIRPVAHPTADGDAGTTVTLLIELGPAVLSEALFLLGYLLLAAMPERSNASTFAKATFGIHLLALLCLGGVLLLGYLDERGVTFATMGAVTRGLAAGLLLFSLLGLILLTNALSTMGHALGTRAVGRAASTFWFVLLVITVVVGGLDAGILAATEPTFATVLAVFGATFGGVFLVGLFFVNMVSQARAAITQFAARASDALG